MIAAIVLAAGRSTRMGTQKLLLPMDGQPVIARIVDEVLRSQVHQTLVVTGIDGAAIGSALRGRRAAFVQNPNPAGDMLSSIRCGVRRLPAECTAFLVVLGDQPNLTSQLLDELIESFGRSQRGIILPVHNHRRGHPVLLSATFRAELLTRHDGAGLRGLLEAHDEEIQLVAVPDGSQLADMDTPRDYEHLRGVEDSREHHSAKSTEGH